MRLAEDLWQIFHRLGASPEFLRSLPPSHRRGADSRVLRCLAGPEAEKLRTVYAADFQRFGYSQELPLQR